MTEVEDVHASKETYYSVKRDLLVSKETYYRRRARPSPTTVSKETYYSIKRDLLQYQKMLSKGAQGAPKP
jgi:hypothetical protein